MTAGTSSYVDLTAGRFHYRQWPADADAPSVVLLHGNGDTSTTWSRVAPALSAAGWAVFAPDLRGNGSSVRPPVGCYGLAEVAADVLELIDRPSTVPAPMAYSITKLAYVGLQNTCIERVSFDHMPLGTTE